MGTRPPRTLFLWVPSDCNSVNELANIELAGERRLWMNLKGTGNSRKNAGAWRAPRFRIRRRSCSKWRIYGRASRSKQTPRMVARRTPIEIEPSCCRRAPGTSYVSTRSRSPKRRCNEKPRPRPKPGSLVPECGWPGGRETGHQVVGNPRCAGGCLASGGIRGVGFRLRERTCEHLVNPRISYNRRALRGSRDPDHGGCGDPAA